MPIQSYLMMYFAGSGWQYGKRKISAMSNEQFNKLTSESLLAQHSIELKNMLPTLDKTLDDVTPLIKTLVEQYGDFVREAIKAIPDAIGNIFQQSGQVGQGTLTNVRLSQGSQQFQRDRELYAGGAPSLYQQDIQRQQQREIERRAKQSELERIARDAEALRNKLARESQKTQDVSKFLTIREKTKQFVGKKAGQSVIMQRNRLIKRIAEQRALIKQHSPKTGQRGRFNPQKRNSAIINMRDLQIALTILLKRYRF